MRFLIPLLILALPLAEIAGFVAVGSEIGVAMTLLLVFASAVAGILLLRIQGFGVLRRLQEAARTGNDPGLDVVGGVLVFIAAILLIVPGFISDVVGLLIFLPPVRRAIAAFLRSRMTILSSATGFYRSSGPRPAGPQASDPRREERRGPLIIDLDEDEFSRKKKDEDDRSPPPDRLSH
ncbi:membrane protein FxsA [Mesorhizobium plurifarium]|uniref:FxsA family protein n=1 Tax=Sinorhizobium arboris TaxID=76745 RepID=UPI0003FCEDF0|nr:FxsA family protein [Sinorhizobium arboris]PST17515.1 membrane protein FxsA [Mesorhizobium plurifarium]